ncbi:MAG: hypothetical protein KF832_18905 [Caldilineaceae bacterium]|nr:hypothetical protein [Caldilineaceae bacterium]
MVKRAIVWTKLLGVGLLIGGLTACMINFGPAQLHPAVPATSPTARNIHAEALTPTLDATQTAAAEVIAEALDAAPAIATPTASPTLRPTNTPDVKSTQTAVAQSIATSVRATLMARATVMPRPIATSTPAAQIQNFATCLDPCRGDGSNRRRTFPERTTKVHLTWLFRNFPIGAHYTRAWTLVGKGEWTRYDCIWPGPDAGTENIALAAPNGLHSGTWEVTITVDETVVLREQLVVEGRWGLWDPPGLFTTCYGTR